MNPDRLLALLVYVFGIYCFGGMCALWLRERSRGGWAGRCDLEPTTSREARWVGGAITWLSLFWFVDHALLVLFGLHSGLSRWPLELGKVAMAFAYPPLIGHVTLVEARCEGRPMIQPGWRVGLGALYVISIAACAVTFFGFFGAFDVPPRRVGAWAGLTLGVLFCLAGTFSGLALARKPKADLTLEQRTARKWMVRLFAVMVGFCVLIILANFGGVKYLQLLDLAASSMPLLFIFAGAYFDSRFEFFDLFIKRSIWLLIVVVLLGGALWLVPTLAGDRLPAWARPWVWAVLLLPVASILPWLSRRISGWVDRVWLGRRFDSVSAVHRFLAGLQRATTREELLSRAEEGFGTIFRAPARILIGEDPGGDAGFPTVERVPIRADGKSLGVILLGRRANQTPYFSEDVSLLRSLGDVFTFMYENIRLQERKREQDELARDLTLQASRSELKALRAQVNPHFLFNALNAIAGLIHGDPAKADRTVEQLAEVFRYTLRRSESEWTRLADEFDFVRAYLEVEQARFGDRLRFEIDLEPGTERLRIPSMMIQTLVENAVKHGVAEVRGPGTIELSARAADRGLRIRVADNGPGFAERRPAPEPSERSRGEGYGLKNVRRRLAAHYGQAARLEVRRDEARGLTEVCLWIPPAETPANDAEEATP